MTSNGLQAERYCHTRDLSCVAEVLKQHRIFSRKADLTCPVNQAPAVKSSDKARMVNGAAD
jgi:hypothetical protein